MRNPSIYESNSVEFQYSDLRLDSKLDARDLVESIHVQVTNDLGLHESCISGVHFLPNENWPQRVKIYCTDTDSKETLLQKGLNLYGGHVKLFEPGQGVKKVEIKNVPGHMPSYLIREVLENFGNIIQFRQEKYKLRSGRQLDWTTGHRIAWMREVESLPPIIKVRFNDKEIMLNVWHYGQTDKYCRHCKDIVAKDHTCPNAPVKKCFDCGSLNHFKSECPVGKTCFTCGGKDHISSLCPYGNKKSTDKQTLGNFFKAGGKENLNKLNPSSRSETFTVGATGNSSDLNPKPRSETKESKGKSPDVPNIESDEEFPAMGKVTHIVGKVRETARPDKSTEKDQEKVSSAKEGTQVGGRKKTKLQRKRGRQRTGYISPLITNYMKVYDETELGSCYDTDEEHFGSGAEESQEEHTQDNTPGKPEVTVKVIDPNGAELVNDGSNTEEVDNKVVGNIEEDSKEEYRTREETEDMEVDDTRKNIVNVVAFGGSNCGHLEEFLKGDDEISIRPRVLHEGGLKVAGVTQKIDEIGDDEAKRDLKYIAMHVGSANFPYNENEDQELMVGQYLAQLYELDTRCPKAEIVVCSIPLRMEHYPSTVQKQINSQINGFNIKLREMADKIGRVHYCNTVPYLTDKEGPCPELYRKPEFDPNGIHLNDIGKMQLAKAITEEFKRIIQHQAVKQKENKEVEESVAQISIREKSSEVLSNGEMNSSANIGRHV